GSGVDYINCPLTREQYDAFVDALLAGDKVAFHEWEATRYFDGCLPIEVMAERGRETLRHGPMKPFGLTNPHPGTIKPYAVVQLRQDNRLGTLFNIVGFQTKLNHGEQTRIFRSIPGLDKAEFARLGGLHRNTFLNAQKLLDATLRLNAMPRLRFAGQITGCEGYVESAAVGLLAGRFAATERLGEALSSPPATTAHGALLNHITGGHVETIDAGPRSYQPMNINFGLFPPTGLTLPTGAAGQRLRGPAKALAKKQALTRRALADLERWIGGAPPLAAEGGLQRTRAAGARGAPQRPLPAPPRHLDRPEGIARVALECAQIERHDRDRQPGCDRFRRADEAARLLVPPDGHLAQAGERDDQSVARPPGKNVLRDDRVAHE